jgi:hypothetical protein
MWCVSHGRHVRRNADNCDLNMVIVIRKPAGACRLCLSGGPVTVVFRYLDTCLVVRLLWCSDTLIPVWWSSYCGVQIC